MPTKKPDPDRADEQPAKPAAANARIKGATLYNGQYYAADGTPLTGPESRQAHQAADAAAAEARRLALLGGGQ